MASVNVCVDVCVDVGVGMGLQVIPPGSGVHQPLLPHTAVISPSGTNPGSHWNTATEPSVVMVCSRDSLIGRGRAPQSAVELKKFAIKCTSVNSMLAVSI